ncbi:MAG: hypothetical protein QOF41_1243 [Methylobacteriaceae bacterium]|nr:hypothetical protein [Methylobacteriaceae bacterium]
MFPVRFGAISAGVLMLSACGTYVPEIEEFWGTPNDATIKVNKISGQVVCELRRAVQRVFWDSEHNPPEFVPAPGHPAPQRRDLKWFEAWAVQVTLNLNIVENSALTPGVTLTRILPNSVIKFPVGGDVLTGQSTAWGLGGTLSSTATRTDKLNMFFTVKELKYGPPSMNLDCLPNSPANADLFIQSDLKLYDWLSAALLPYDANIINYANNATAQNAISHEVKFQIVSNANLTPMWKLVRVAANTSGTLFAAGRDRTQDLTITFGPPNGTKAPQLATPAENAHLATQIGLAVSQALRSP